MSKKNKLPIKVREPVSYHHYDRQSLTAESAKMVRKSPARMKKVTCQITGTDSVVYNNHIGDSNPSVLTDTWKPASLTQGLETASLKSSFLNATLFRQTRTPVTLQHVPPGITKHHRHRAGTHLPQHYRSQHRVIKRTPLKKIELFSTLYDRTNYSQISVLHWI